MDDVAKIDGYHLSLVAYYANKLKSIQDGDGTLLDSVILSVGGGLGNPNVHAVMDLSTVVIGGGAGKIKGNRHGAYKVEDYTPQANLWLTLLDRAGVHVEKHGDSTGRLREIDV
jgi:hypothetical protein